MGRRIILEVDLPDIIDSGTTGTYDTTYVIPVGAFEFEVYLLNDIMYIKPINLDYNLEIMITIDSTLLASDGTSMASDAIFWYTTIMGPVYCTPTIIRLSEGLGAYITDVSDDTIWRMILKNSINAHVLWYEQRKRLVIVNNKIPWCVLEYVKYQTILDLLNHLIFLFINLSGTKTLADLSISNNGPSAYPSYFTELRREVNDKMEENKKSLKNGCKRLAPIYGIRSFDYWEPIPIVQPDRTWKRYPKVQEINALLANMIPAAQGGRDLRNVNQAFDRGNLVIPTKFDGFISEDE